MNALFGLYLESTLESGEGGLTNGQWPEPGPYLASGRAGGIHPKFATPLFTQSRPTHHCVADASPVTSQLQRADISDSQKELLPPIHVCVSTSSLALLDRVHATQTALDDRRAATRGSHGSASVSIGAIAAITHSSASSCGILRRLRDTAAFRRDGLGMRQSDIIACMYAESARLTALREDADRKRSNLLLALFNHILESAAWEPDTSSHDGDFGARRCVHLPGVLAHARRSGTLGPKLDAMRTDRSIRPSAHVLWTRKQTPLRSFAPGVSDARHLSLPQTYLAHYLAYRQQKERLEEAVQHLSRKDYTSRQALYAEPRVVVDTATALERQRIFQRMMSEDTEQSDNHGEKLGAGADALMSPSPRATRRVSFSLSMSPNRHSLHLPAALSAVRLTTRRSASNETSRHQNSVEPQRDSGRPPLARASASQRHASASVALLDPFALSAAAREGSPAVSTAAALATDDSAVRSAVQAQRHPRSTHHSGGGLTTATSTATSDMHHLYPPREDDLPHSANSGSACCDGRASHSRSPSCAAMPPTTATFSPPSTSAAQPHFWHVRGNHDAAAETGEEDAETDAAAPRGISCSCSTIAKEDSAARGRSVSHPRGLSAALGGRVPWSYSVSRSPTVSAIRSESAADSLAVLGSRGGGNWGNNEAFMRGESYLRSDGTGGSSERDDEQTSEAAVAGIDEDGNLIYHTHARTERGSPTPLWRSPSQLLLGEGGASPCHNAPMTARYPEGSCFNDLSVAEAAAPASAQVASDTLPFNEATRLPPCSSPVDATCYALPPLLAKKDGAEKYVCETSKVYCGQYPTHPYDRDGQHTLTYYQCMASGYRVSSHCGGGPTSFLGATNAEGPEPHPHYFPCAITGAPQKALPPHALHSYSYEACRCSTSLGSKSARLSTSNRDSILLLQRPTRELRFSSQGCSVATLGENASLKTPSKSPSLENSQRCGSVPPHPYGSVEAAEVSRGQVARRSSSTDAKRSVSAEASSSSGAAFVPSPVESPAAADLRSPVSQSQVPLPLSSNENAHSLARYSFSPARKASESRLRGDDTVLSPQRNL